MHPNNIENGNPPPYANNESNIPWLQAPLAPDDQYRDGVLVPGPSVDAPNTVRRVYNGFPSLPQLSFGPCEPPFAPFHGNRAPVLDPAASPYVPGAVRYIYDGLPALPPSFYGTNAPTGLFRENNLPVSSPYTARPRETEDPPTSPNPIKDQREYVLSHWIQPYSDPREEMHDSTNEETHSAEAQTFSLFQRTPFNDPGWEAHKAQVRDLPTNMGLYQDKDEYGALLDSDKQIRVWDYIKGIEGPASPPTSFKDFLANRAHTSIHGPMSRPADDPNPELEDMVRLFKQLDEGTPHRVMFDTNDRIIELPGEQHILQRIATNANDCRDRYLRVRLALFKALGLILEVESLVRHPLGGYNWDCVDAESPFVTPDPDKHCKHHIDGVMVMLDRVEGQLKNLYLQW